MHPHRSTLLAALLAAVFLLALAFAFAPASGQEASPAGAIPPDLAPVPTLAADPAATLVAGLAARFPLVSSLLMVIGLLRLLVKPVMAYLHARAAATEETEDDARLDRIERSWWLRALLFALDWGASIKPPARR